MSTATSLSLRCAALTAAPSSAHGAGGDRRRLPLPGPASWAAGSAGSRGFGFTFNFTCLSMAPPPKPKATMLACANKKATGGRSEWGSIKRDEKKIDELYADLSKEHEHFRSNGDEGDEFYKFYAALSAETEQPILSNVFILRPIKALSEEDWEVQNKLKEIVERCMDLQADAMRRLRPDQRFPLYVVFRTTHFAFNSVKIRATEGHANLGVSAILIAHKLDVVRKMVSSACAAPLPLDRDKQAEISLLPPLVDKAIAGLVGADSNSEEAVAFALMEYAYDTVKSDIDEMFTASDTASATS